MIKFFRKIRQNLLGQGKTSQYMKYAIGEIVLVVIGILIALSINNWNEKRKDKLRRTELLQGVASDLQADIFSLKMNIDFYENRVAFNDRQLAKTNHSDTPLDTILAWIDGSTGTFTVNNQSFQKIKNLGLTEISTNDTLANRIASYYTYFSDNVKIMMDYGFSETQKENTFWFNTQDEIEMVFDATKSYPILQDSIRRKENAVRMIMTPQGRNHLRLEQHRNGRIHNYLNGMLGLAEQLLVDVETYLNE